MIAIRLTDAEREELAAVSWPQDIHIAPVVESIIAARLADAWDEGHRFTGYAPSVGENPYRAVPHPQVDGVARYLDLLERTNPSPEVQAVIDEIRAEVTKS